MNVWFTSDIHHGHLKVAELRFPHVPVEYAIQYHNARLAQGWDSVVQPDDQIWVLGDISSGTKTGQLKALEWIKERPGQKHLICGNHDSSHPMHRDSHKWQRVYLEAFESVQMAAKRRIAQPQPLGGHHNVMLSHFPYKHDRGDECRHPEWRLKNRGHILLHGHTHLPGKVTHDIEHQGGSIIHVAKQIHVGVDAWDFAPVPLETITELVNQ